LFGLNNLIIVSKIFLADHSLACNRVTNDQMFLEIVIRNLATPNRFKID